MSKTRATLQPFHDPAVNIGFVAMLQDYVSGIGEDGNSSNNATIFLVWDNPSILNNSHLEYKKNGSTDFCLRQRFTELARTNSGMADGLIQGKLARQRRYSSEVREKEGKEAEKRKTKNKEDSVGQ
ncbi:uncharacterized protein LOC117224337 [Megalopta genalis]|uniref:uncharacterized protein LOC117224337 n=1 Tax=Megalopta genalis TaxID=115081 RepID=UPI003FD25791